MAVGSTLPGVEALGVAMSPADVFIELRQLMGLDDDEILEALAKGACRVLNGDAGPVLLEAVGDAEKAAAAAAGATRSRLRAWRTRSRQMTWPELRLLLLGLRDLVQSRQGTRDPA